MLMFLYANVAKIDPKMVGFLLMLQRNIFVLHKVFLMFH